MDNYTNLKRIRIESGKSQSEIASATGISIRTIQKYEQRERDINKAYAMNVYLLSEALNCRVKDLLEM